MKQFAVLLIFALTFAGAFGQEEPTKDAALAPPEALVEQVYQGGASGGLSPLQPATTAGATTAAAGEPTAAAAAEDAPAALPIPGLRAPRVPSASAFSLPTTGGVKSVATVASMLSGANAARLSVPPQGAEIIPGAFIVVLERGANANAALRSLTAAVSRKGGSVTSAHTGARGGFRGMSFTLPMTTTAATGGAASTGGASDTNNATTAVSAAATARAARSVAALMQAVVDTPGVKSVEPDQVARAVYYSQSRPQSWGLNRIDGSTSDNAYRFTSQGAGTCLYSIDTGVRATHVDVAGRVKPGYSITSTANDDNGHGTHTTGTAAGYYSGVAKQATIIPIKVLDSTGHGSYSAIISGINLVSGDKQCPNAVRRRVINMSLGGGYSAAMNDAVVAAYNAGVTVVVAAGNDNQNACNVSPASSAGALTVGAVTSTLARSSFSNWGGCVDLFAPGSAIISAWPSSDYAAASLDGTSMASPHVAGLALRALSAGLCSSPGACFNYIKANAVAGAVSNPGTGSNNRLAKMLYTA